MKKIVYLFFLILPGSHCLAQQQPQYTQFLYNKLAITPGYAGSDEAICITALYRSQWMGLEGAPESQLVSVSAPLLNRRIGLGLLIGRESIGISRNINVVASYAYRVRIEKGMLGIGLQASVLRYNMNYNDTRLRATQNIGSDGGIPVGDQSRMLPNFGVGIYYETAKYYIGLGTPRLIRNSIDFNELSGKIAREVNHSYLMAGLRLPLSDLVALQPQFLIKYVPDIPVDLDLNLSFILADRFTAGVTYRLGGGSEDFGESIDLLVAASLTRELLFGLSYDITLSKIRSFSNGSIEAIMQYCIGKPLVDDIINPRFF